MGDFSVFIFISVILVAVGYAVGNTRSFSLWKLFLVLACMIPFVIEFNIGRGHLIFMFVSFMTGLLLPYAHLLEGFSESISDAINAIRYKDAYEHIRRKEAEVEELRRKYSQDQRENMHEERNREEAKRKEQSNQYRQQNREKKEEESKQNKSTGSDQKKQSSGRESKKDKYLKILGLDPNRNYSYSEIKKAYQRKASKVHPDRYQNKDKRIWEEMNELFKLVNEAYEWLGIMCKG